MAKTVVGLFDDRGVAHDVVRELISEGFARDRISVMQRQPEGTDIDRGAVEYVEEDGREQVEDMAKGAGAGAAIGGTAALLLSLTAVAIPGIGLVLAAGPLAALLAGAGVGAAAGGLVSGLTRLGVEEDEADTYAEGLRRGGTLVSVVSPDHKADRAVSVMKHLGAVEIDKRAAEWRAEGWTGLRAETLRPHVNPDHAEGAERAAAPLAQRRDATEITAEHEPVAAPLAAQTEADEFNVPPPEVAIPVVEEELRVGKREVERGGVRVQKRVTETPVEEEVTLREEHVNVERRPADYTFHGSEVEAFQESVVEIREAYEEMIVNKKARVVEEIVIGKDVEERTETVHETLRRTDVEVEPLEPGRARGAAAAADDRPRRADDADANFNLTGDGRDA
jgi:uncharacterized protein (TIGR02271 family)